MPINQRSFLFTIETKIYDLLETVRSFSSCSDKQVAACCVDMEDNILSISYNNPTHNCDNCNRLPHPKNCAIHAEKGLKIIPGSFVYLTTFPCIECQIYLFSAGVTDIFVFGKQHKEDTGLLTITLLPDIVGILTDFNGIEKQKNVITGELGELITAIANTSRKDSREDTVQEEVVDVQLQLFCLNRIKKMHLISGERYIKYTRLINKFKTEEETEC